MNQVSTSSIVLAIATLVTFLFCLSGMVFAFFMHTGGIAMFLACAGLAVMFGLMVRNDYYKLFQKK